MDGTVPALVINGAEILNNAGGTSGVRFYCPATSLPSTDVQVQFFTYRAGTSNWSVGTGFLKWRIRKVSNGNMAEQPPVVSCEAFLNANTAVGSNSPILFNSIVEDTHGGYDSTTGRYTCKVAGKYILSGQLYTTTSTVGLNMYKGGVAYKPVCGLTTSIASSICVTLRLAVGESIDLRPAGAVTMQGAATLATSNTRFEITRVGS